MKETLHTAVETAMHNVANERKATEIIEAALRTLDEREEIYGPATEHFQELTDFRNNFFFAERTPKDVALEAALAKLDRIRRTDCDSETFRDSYIDAINYLAISWALS